MSNFYGADVEQLRALAQEILYRAQEVSAAASRLSARIDDVHWSGPDGERFKARWASELRLDLKRVSTRMEDAAQSALANAREQEEKSSGASSSNPAPPPSPAKPGLPPGIARDMAYREGRDYVWVNGERVSVQDNLADTLPPYIEIDGRRIYSGDADWPPLVQTDPPNPTSYRFRSE